MRSLLCFVFLQVVSSQDFFDKLKVGLPGLFIYYIIIISLLCYMSHCHYGLLLSFTSDLLHVTLSSRSSLVVYFSFVVIVITVFSCGLLLICYMSHCHQGLLFSLTSDLSLLSLFSFGYVIQSPHFYFISIFSHTCTCLYEKEVSRQLR